MKDCRMCFYHDHQSSRRVQVNTSEQVTRACPVPTGSWFKPGYKCPRVHTQEKPRLGCVTSQTLSSPAGLRYVCVGVAGMLGGVKFTAPALTFSSSALWCSNSDLRALRTSTSLETPAGEDACRFTTVILSDRSCRDTRHSKCSSNSWNRLKQKWVFAEKLHKKSHKIHANGIL